MNQWQSGALRLSKHTKIGPFGQPEVGRHIKWAWFLILALLGLAACTGRRPAEPPTLELKSPEDGVRIALGERVLVQSLAEDDQAVVKTELWVDGRLYEVEHADQDAGNPALDAIHIWEASTLGSHTLLVRAYENLRKKLAEYEDFAR